MPPSCLIFLLCIVFFCVSFLRRFAAKKKEKKKKDFLLWETICESYHILTLWTLGEVFNEAVIYRRCSSQLTWQHCSHSPSEEELLPARSYWWQFWSSVCNAARRLIRTRTWIPLAVLMESAGRWRVVMLLCLQISRMRLEMKTAT